MPALPAALLALLLHAHLCRPAPLNGNALAGKVFLGLGATLTQPPWLLPRAGRCSPHPPSLRVALPPSGKGAAGARGLRFCLSPQPSPPAQGKRPEKALRPDRRLSSDLSQSV